MSAGLNNRRGSWWSVYRSRLGAWRRELGLCLRSFPVGRANTAGGWLGISPRSGDLVAGAILRQKTDLLLESTPRPLGKVIQDSCAQNSIQGAKEKAPAFLLGASHPGGRQCIECGEWAASGGPRCEDCQEDFELNDHH